MRPEDKILNTVLPRRQHAKSRKPVMQLATFFVAVRSDPCLLVHLVVGVYGNLDTEGELTPTLENVTYPYLTYLVIEVTS